MRNLLLLTTLIAYSSFIAGCGGFGLGPGGDMGMIPSAADVENPAKKGTIKGQIGVAEGFIPLFMEYLNSSADQGISTVYKHVNVHILGANGKWSTSVDEKGNFEFPPVYSGRYVLKVQYKEHLLFYHDLVLLDKAEFELQITVVGYDLADINNNDEKFELLFQIKAKYSENDVEYFRIINPDGSQQTILPDGTREFAKGGIVRILNNDGQIEYRKDFDNDFIPDHLDFDDDNDGISDSRDRDLGNNGIPDRFEKKEKTVPGTMSFIEGQTSIPIITNGNGIIMGDSRRSLSDLNEGDVIMFSAKTETGGGPPVNDMDIRIYSFGRPVFSFKLYDDGSEADLLKPWNGMQVSGDKIKNDGIFTSLIPVDNSTITALNNSLLLFTGRNRLGNRTNSFILPMAITVTSKDEKANVNLTMNKVADNIADCGLYKAGDSQIIATIDVTEVLSDSLIASILMPSGGTKMLSFSKREGSIFTFSSSKLSIEKGLYILIAKSSSGGVFYAGFPVKNL